MQKIKDVLRLHFLGQIQSSRQLARAAGCGKSAVSDCLRRARVAGLTDWAQIAALDEAELSQRLYRARGSLKRTAAAKPLPDWAKVREELARCDHQVTLALLWEEYKTAHPDGYQYSRFAELYRAYEKRLSVVLRQAHRAGEKSFVDYCDGLALIDERTGARTPTELFVGALGASSYTFARATLSQSLPDWLDCHVRMYEAFGGVSAITVPDNLRSGVTSPDRYEAEINPSYRELAEHYGTCIIPARVRKPRDKAKVEAAVLVAQRWILAVLRHRRFHHLQEMNAAIDALCVKLNDRTMRHVKQSRRQLWERLDRPALKALPARAYEYAEWKCATVNIDYHIVFDEHFYSVPYTLVGETVWCRASARIIEIIHGGKRIACHVRSFVKYHYSTTPEHRPASHRAHLEWTPSRLIDWGKSIGVHTAALIEHVIRSKPHPEQGYRSALGILRLSKRFDPKRLELACARALDINSPSYRTIKTMLKQRMEGAQQSELTFGAESSATLGAANVRGPRYYH